MSSAPLQPTPGSARPHRRRPLSAAALAACLCLAACQSQAGGPDASKEVDRLLADGKYQQAVEVAAKHAERSPDAAPQQALWQRASGAYWLDQGRQLTFQDRQEEALPAFERAYALMPASQAAREWLDKGHAELASIARSNAFEAEASGQVELAREQYAVALQHVPGDRASYIGLERVKIIESYNKERASEYYTEGVTALRELRTAEAIQRFQASLKYRPEAPESLLRQQEVNRLLAEERLSVGRELEELGLFRAARAEYRMSKLVMTDYAPAVEGFDRVDREVEVLDLLETADQKLRGKQFEACLALLDQALERTQLQKEHVTTLQEQAEQERVDALYQRALLLEEDFRYPEAIAAYEVLLNDQDGFYLDARARQGTLKTYMADAERLYGEAAAAAAGGDRGAELKLLRQIELIWPSYLDVAQRVRELSAKQPEPESSGP